ncbi:MAG: UDP-N-acetylmuramoyl-L-alanine--D-glutamate ligase [Ignavibacteriae bacterium]|nr:MAG: UDP-N-acetylmuramoyl-L-alanine--D-glutamate ligase [Ignavibacteriota bacterium]
MQDYKNYKSFSIIGAARSGVAAAKLLKNKGYKVFLSDAGNLEKINKDFIKELKEHNIDFETGRHSEKVYESDALIVSPGVPQNSTVIQEALKKGKEVVSEVEAASWFCKGKIISITGTNGKTTTTTLIGEIFKDAGYKTFVCGNIGVAFCDVVDNIDEDGIAVVETSSFQLDNIKNFKPYISILLNITPDHLNRYENSFNNYINSKLRVIENQDGNDYFIFNYDDEIIRQSMNEKVKAQLIPFSIKQDLSNVGYDSGAYPDNNRLIYFNNTGKENVIDAGNLIIKGQHNIYNSLASIISAKIFKIKRELINKTLSEFKGVEHRLEYVRELDGVKFYNDSKATNVNSVWYALQGFSEPIILILGGRDKGNDYSEIENEVKQNVKHIIAIGESKEKVYNYFKEKMPVTLAGDMTDAVNKAFQYADKNNVVLLSPACASFDMFDSYEHRGSEFKRIVNELNGK